MGGSAGDCDGLKEADRRSRRGSKGGQRGFRREDLGADAVEKTGPTSGPRWSAAEGAVHGGTGDAGLAAAAADGWAAHVSERGGGGETRACGLCGERRWRVTGRGDLGCAREAAERVWRKRASQGNGLGRRAGPRAQGVTREGAGTREEGGLGRPGAWVGLGCHLGFPISYFFPLFYFKHHSNLFEFKSNLNSNSYALKHVKLMHQHECTNKLALK